MLVHMDTYLHSSCIFRSDAAFRRVRNCCNPLSALGTLFL
jgi:hypothetical protein